MMDDEQERKQKYLRMEILDKGYDGSEFAAYLADRRDGGSDINSWSLNDLIEEVKLFQANNSAGQEEGNNENYQNIRKSGLYYMNNEDDNNNLNKNRDSLIPIGEENEIQAKNDEDNDGAFINNEFDNLEQILNGTNDKNRNQNQNLAQRNVNSNSMSVNKPKGIQSIQNEVPKNSNEIAKSEMFPKAKQIAKSKVIEIQCMGMEKNKFTEIPNVQLKVDSFNKVKGKDKKHGLKGLLSTITNEVLYTFKISILPTNPQLSIDRDYRDFYWLKENLKNLFPGIFIPSLKQRKIDENSPEKKIKKIENELNDFMKSIANDPLLLGSDILNDFLTIKEQKDFEFSKKMYEKIQLTKASDFHYRESPIKINVMWDNPDLYRLNLSNVNENFNLLTKLKSAMKGLDNDISNVVKRMNEISGIFLNLSECARIFNSDVSQLRKNYDTSKVLMDSLRFFQEELRKNIKENIYYSYKNELLDVEYLKRLLEKASNKKKKFDQDEDALMFKKVDLYKRGDTQWKLGKDLKDMDVKKQGKSTEKDESKLEDTKNVALFLIQSFVEEFKRTKLIYSNKAYKLISKFYVQNKNTIDDLKQSWTNYVKNVGDKAELES